MAAENPALVAEDRYRALLGDGRGRDAAAGRALVGHANQGAAECQS